MIFQRSSNLQCNVKWILILIYLAKKISSNPYITSYFNDNIVRKVQIQKHGGLLVDQKESLDEHFQCIFTKTCKIIELIRKLQPVLSGSALLTIYKSFLRLYLEYGDIIYDCVFNESFQNKLESVQCNAALAITGAIRGSSWEKLYQELDLKSLKSRQWY